MLNNNHTRDARDEVNRDPWTESVGASLALGLCITQGRRMGLLPDPGTEFHGLSFESVSKAIRTMINEEHIWLKDTKTGSGFQLGYLVKSELEKVVKKQQTKLKGLLLKSFGRKPSDNASE